MARLPQPGSDNGEWGAILNSFLAVAHETDGSVRAGSIAETHLTDPVKDKLNAVASGGATNLSVATTTTSVIVASDTGTDATLPATTPSTAGVMTAADKTKLDGIASGAQVNVVTSVAARTGDVTLTKTDVGLANVDNTTDAAKPISALTQTALNGKADSAHTHALAALTGVTLTSPSFGQVLKYNGSAWVNDTDATGSGSGTTNLSTTTSATTVTVVSDTGTDATLAAATGSVAGVLTAADKTKLDSIATSATANSTDAQLRDRATHTGSQTASTISDFAEVARDTLATALVAGSNVTITPNDGADTITIAASSGSADTGIVTTNSQSGTTYTLVLGDTGLLIETTSASAVTITVPPNSSVAFLNGATIALRQYGVGQVTIAAGVGVTIHSRGGVFNLGGQYAEAVLTKRATDEWMLSGDLSA